MLAAVTVGIDARFAALPVGLGTYTRELTRALVAGHPDLSFVLFVRDASEAWTPKHPNVRIMPAPFAHYSFAEHLKFPKLIKQSKVDLFFAPQFNVPYFCPVPFVATIHDLILHKYPNQASFMKRMAYKILMKRTISRAKAICTVSNATKNDLLGVYGRSIEHKVHTASPGISERFTAQSAENIASARSRYHLPERYVLYVGNAKEHKNVQMLLDAFTDLDDPTLHLALVLFGKEADHLKLSDRMIRLKNIPDHDLALMYAGSVGFASATFYEGFGLPFLEAMACGVPVLGTSIPSLTEVCGGHALLIDATREAFTQGLRTFHARNEHALHAAAAYASTFTWKKTADSVATILKQ